MDLENTLRWTEKVTLLAKPFGYEPAIVLAIIYVESRGNPSSINQTSMATGLMQVMPRESNEEIFASRPLSFELLDPEVNIIWGLKVLRWSHRDEPSLWGALYRYSGGQAWQSEKRFTETYWMPFCEAWAEIAMALREQGRTK